MNSEPEKELQQRLQQLESEINSTSVPNYQVRKIPHGEKSSFTNVSNAVSQISQWFKGLSKTAQIVVLGVGFLITLAMVQAIFKLLAAAISLTMLAVLVYLGYKFFVSK